MTRTSTLVAIVTMSAAASPSVGLRAQDPTPPPRPGQTELVGEREVFSYPMISRRNPFVPLSGDFGGMRFEQLTLIGVIYSTDPSASVALLTTGSVSVAPDGTTTAVEGDAYYLKVGQSVGNTTIVEIQRDRVIVNVVVFDAVETHTMFFDTRRQGGTP